MADENTEPEEGAEEGTPVIEVQENITKAQWLGILGLFLSIIYLYFLWPIGASKEINLKDPEVYIQTGRELFDLAHGERAFPRDDRINTLQDVTWNYEASIRSGSGLSLEDRYRWAYASYHVQIVRHPQSRYAFVSALDNFILTLEQIEAALPHNEEAKGDEYLERKRVLDELPVKCEKVKYMLASAFLRVGRYEKAVPLLKDLQKLEHDYKLYQRRRDRLGLALDAQGPVELGASPYRMQLSELEKVNLLLGQAYEKLEQPNEAIQALEAYLESTRELELAELDVDTGAKMESRYMALKTLASIHFNEYRNLRNELKKLKVSKASFPEIAKVEKAHNDHLKGALEKLSLLFNPAYSVYGLEEEKLKYAEVAYRLNMNDRVLKVAEEFDAADPHRNNEMKLWRIMAQLNKNIKAPVTPELTSIANDNTHPPIKLAALVLLGDNQVENGEVDKALGGLIPAYKDQMGKSDVGSYFRSVIKYKEEDFDENSFIGKINLIDATMQRANQAKKDSDEKLSIKLYRFLLEHFTVPKATILHEIAALKRIIGRELLAEHGLNKDVKLYFKDSAEHYLMTEDFSEVDYDQDARDESYFQAAESYFEGGYYSLAYKNYGKFITERSNDDRVTKARFKKGMSALYRKFENIETRKPATSRLHDARQEFEINMTKDIRQNSTNRDLPSTEILNTTSDRVALDKYLNTVEYYNRISNLGTLSDNVNLVEVIAAGNTENIQSLEEMLNDDYFKEKVMSLGNISDNRDELRKLIVAEANDIHAFNKLLSSSDRGPRDMWAYQSTYEFARTYQAEYRYERAEKVYNKIMNDSRFEPRSEVWRKAAYARAKMTYDKVSERVQEPKPWEEAIGKLEDVLTLYDLRDFHLKFSNDDTDLYQEFRRSNAELKYYLAKAYLQNGDADNAKQQCLDLLNQKKYFDISLEKGETQKTQLVTEQKVEALLADAYFDLNDYINSMEHYRRAHDRNLQSWERPFYSLSIVDCLIGLKRYEDAKNRLKRTRWEFENEQVYEEDDVVFQGDEKLSRQDWLALVEQRMELIP
jgi:predicted Zn-dependent protease